MATTRADHLKWCKERALKYLETEDLAGAFASIMSDLPKHEKTKNHTAIELGGGLQSGGFLNSVDDMKKFINDIG